ncbi:MAG: hypothetical protein JWM20_484 [Patescibacteria group bacterium]|nr:hypothetical protein [Patescibacteria group bacterium]
MKHVLISKKKSWFRSPIVSIILVACIAWGIFSVIRAYGKDREAVNLRNQEKKELNDLQAKQSELNTEITNLSTDRGIEAEIRNRYRVERPGEHLVIVVDNSDGKPAEEPKLGWFARLRAYLGW